MRTFLLPLSLLVSSCYDARAVRRGVDEAWSAVHDAGVAVAGQNAGIDRQVQALEERVRAIVALRSQIDANALQSPNDSTKIISPTSVSVTTPSWMSFFE